MLQIQTVLFPADPSTWSETAFTHALRYAQRHGAVLHALTVSESSESEKGTLSPIPLGEPGTLNTRLREVADKGVEVVSMRFTASSVARGILDYAARVGADLIVMAMHERQGLDQRLVGSVPEAVVRHAQCPVLVVRPAALHLEQPPQRMLVPLDFSAHARKALAHARELWQATEAELHLLHVVPTFPSYGFADGPPEPGPIIEVERRDAERALREVAAEVLGPDIPIVTHVVPGQGNPALALLEAAERLEADLVVLASHGRTGVQRFLLGSVAEKVVQHTPCPVFVVKAFGKSLLPGVDVQTRAEPT